MLGPQRAGWMWAEFTTKLGRMGCLCSVTSPRSKHLQQNESYFHNLHINRVWIVYITSVELFMDLKPRICEVWDIITICEALCLTYKEVFSFWKKLHMQLRVAELFNILHPIRSHSFHLTSHHRQLTGHTERQNPEKNI